MKRMLTLKPHRFGGKLRKPGDEYEAGRAHARIMQALGVATRAPEPAPEPINSFFDEPVDLPKPKRKYTYKRRDLKAESSDE